MDQNASSPTTSQPQISSSLTIQTSLGFLALLCNTIAILIILTNRSLLKKSAFLMGVVMSNLCVAIGFFVSGVYRIVLTLWNTVSDKTTVSYCLETTIPELLMTTFCLPACVLLVIGVERLVAVSQPTWYHTKWNHKRSWRVLGITFLFAFVSVAFCSVASFWLATVDKVTKSCSWISMIGVQLTGYIYFTSILGGSAAVLCTLVAFCIGKHRFTKLPQHATNLAMRAREKKQLRLTKAMLCTATLDFVLVVIPNMFLCLTYVFHVSVFDNTVYYSIYTYNCNAIANILAQLLFNSEFKKATIKFFGLERFRWFKNKVTASGGQTVVIGGATRTGNPVRINAPVSS